MHRNHDIFVEAIQGKNKVKLTFYSNENGEIRDRLFGPILYSPSTAGDDSDCYYLWDFEGGNNNSFIGLPPSQIVKMELINESFDFVKFFTSKGANSDSKWGFGEDFPEITRKKHDGTSF